MNLTLLNSSEKPVKWEHDSVCVFPQIILSLLQKEKEVSYRSLGKSLSRNIQTETTGTSPILVDDGAELREPVLPGDSGGVLRADTGMRKCLIIQDMGFCFRETGVQKGAQDGSKEKGIKWETLIQA